MCKYAVIDLEMCRVSRSARKGKNYLAKETIQIGAVLLNESLEKVGEFMTYVLPEYGYIDSYINGITGISKKQVASAPNMTSALKLFMNWLPNDTKVVAWSGNDEKQIRHEILAKEIKIDGLEELFETWIDCQKTFAEKMNNQRCYNLKEALIAADIQYREGEHDALVDAHNTALLFEKMKREEKLILNPYYQKAISVEKENIGFMLGSLFAGLDLANLAVA